MAINKLDTRTLRIVEAEKLKELKAQQKNLKHLQSELKKIKLKLKHNQHLSENDIKILSELGWLAALGVTITALASAI
jgi:hypothetical protein